MRGQGLIAVLAACVLASGCGRAPPSHGPAAPASPAPAAYTPPPGLVRADRRATTVILTGNAAPAAAIRLASPDGSAITGAADRKGVWRLAAPVGATPRLYSLSELAGARLVRAVGYIAVLPAPGPPAAVLRPAASAALPRADLQRGLTALDFDSSGAAMASGRASPSESVRLLLDGKEAGEDRADAAGVFSAALSQTMSPGAHVLELAGERLRASAAFTATRASQVATPPFDAERLDGAWRIDWMTPGGGVQSTVLFDQRGGGRP